MNKEHHIGLKFWALKAAWVLILSLLLPVMVGIGQAKGIGSLEKWDQKQASI